jgi:integrase
MPRVMWKKERQRFLRALEAPDQPHQIRREAFFMLAYDTGARVSELVALDLGDIDAERETIQLINVKMKGHPRREVPLHPDTFEALRCWLEVRPEVDTTAIFVSNRKRRLSKRRAQEEYESICLKAGIRPRGIHTLRHTSATRLLDDKVLEVHQVARRLGHASINTTQKFYLHSSVEKEAEDIRKSDL